MGTPSAREGKIARDTLRQSLRKFDADELEVLRKIFKELASRSAGIGIDRETFLHYFDLPGLWGERLFRKFDLNGSDSVEWDEFITGIAICCRGTKADKLKILYQVFDLNEDGVIQKSELTAMLSNFPAMTKRLTRSAIDLEDYGENILNMASPNFGSLPSRSGSLASLEFRPKMDQVNKTPNNRSLKIFHKHTIDLQDLDSSLDRVSFRSETSDASLTPKTTDRDHQQKSQSTLQKIPSDYAPFKEADSPLGPNDGNVRDGCSDVLTVDDHFNASALDPRDLDTSEFDAAESLESMETPPGFDTLEFSARTADAGVASMDSVGFGSRNHQNSTVSSRLPQSRVSIANSIVVDFQDEQRHQFNNARLDMLVEQILQDCKFREDGGLTFEMFKAWVSRNESILDMFSACLHQEAWALEGVAFYHAPHNGQDTSIDLNIYKKFSSVDDKFDTEDAVFAKDAAKRAMCRSFILGSGLHKTLHSFEASVDVDCKLTRNDSEGDLHESFHGDLQGSFQTFLDSRKSLLGCPKCRTPLLMCPRCYARFPSLQLAVKGDEFRIDCDGCKKNGHEGFDACWICNFKFAPSNAGVSSTDDTSGPKTCFKSSRESGLLNSDASNFLVSSCRSFTRIENCTSMPTVEIFPKVTKSGYLYKIGRHLKQWKKRYHVLIGNVLYYYLDSTSTLPKGFIFLEGCYLDVGDVADFPGKYGFSICNHHQAINAKKRVLYAQEQDDYYEWLDVLSMAMRQQTLTQKYDLYEQLGQGKFSNVYRAVEKDTGTEFAAKIMDKTKITRQERELLRSEIALLGLIRHPHIIYLREVIDAKDSLCIVMELVRGGELYDLIRDVSTLPEGQAHRLITQLLETVAYLHKCGIVHRDIKPENLLLDDKSTRSNIKLTDFGLSTLCGPNDVLTQPCGTLAYVAPEVLTLTGYNQKADVWSIGILLFLLLRGRLPFSVKRLVPQPLEHYNLVFDNGWDGISNSAKDLVTKMLQVDATKRITAAEALEHIWISNFVAVQHHQAQEPQHQTTEIDVFLSLRHTTDASMHLDGSDTGEEQI